MTGSLHPRVSVWVLDKREVTQTEARLVELCRHDVQVRVRCRRALINWARHQGALITCKTSDCIKWHGLAVSKFP